MLVYGLLNNSVVRSVRSVTIGSPYVLLQNGINVKIRTEKHLDPSLLELIRQGLPTISTRSNPLTEADGIKTHRLHNKHPTSKYSLGREMPYDLINRSSYHMSR